MSSLVNPVTSIRDRLNSTSCLRFRVLWGAKANVPIGDLLSGSSLDCHPSELWGRSILLTTRDQLASALALIELDGIAQRIVICPPEITPELFPSLIQKAG